MYREQLWSARHGCRCKQDSWEQIQIPALMVFMLHLPRCPRIWDSLQLPSPSTYNWTLCCCSVAKLCPTFFDSMVFSMPGSPVLHYLLSLLKLMSIESVMPSNHFILCCPLLLLPSIFLRSSPEVGSFSMSWLLSSGSQSIGASASATKLGRVKPPKLQTLRDQICRRLGVYPHPWKENPSIYSCKQLE